LSYLIAFSRMYMAMVKKSITLTEQQNRWIKAQIASGMYGNESEVVRELIRERQLRECENARDLEIIRAKLVEAENQGFTQQTAMEILQEIKKGFGRNEVLQDQ